MNTKINGFLESQSAVDVIASFDVGFDIPLLHDHAVGLLEMLGAFERSKLIAADLPALAVYVGASWCRIVSADVRYRLLDGIETIDSSNDHANQLEKLVLERGAERETGLAADNTDFQAYVIARWLDGAGKLRYRAGNHTEGRMLFERAVQVCRHSGLWWCEPDLVSNFLRSRFEELRVVQEKAVVFKQLETALQEAVRKCGDRNIPVPPIEGQHINLVQIGTREREYLRGFSSLLHNFAVTAVKDKPELAMDASRRSEAICLANGDEYRTAQAVLFQAQEELRRGNAAAARQLFERIVRGKWKRGQLISRQNLARLEGFGDIRERVGHLSAIFDEIAADSAGRGGQTGLDLDFHAYTVAALDGILQNGKAMDGVPSSLRSQWTDLLDAQRTIMIQSLRRVVLIAPYKQKFSKWVRPIFLNRIQRAVNSEKPEHAFSLVEESSARELLDLMLAAAQQELPPPKKQRLPAFAAGTFTAAAGDDSPSKDRIRRGGLRTLNAGIITELQKVLEQRRKEFDDAFLNRQITSVPHDPDVAHRTRMFVANDRGACLIRYFGYGADKNGLPTKLGAFVFRGRNMTLVPNLDLHAVRRLHEANLQVSCPTQDNCRLLWDAVIEPIRHLVSVQSGEGGIESWPSNLVIIPSDVLFNTPLHAALDSKNDMPLGAIVPLCFSVSTAAHINRGRHLYRWQVVEGDDDLCAMIVPDEKGNISGSEIEGISWQEERFHVAGLKPRGVVGKPHFVGNSADFDAFLKLMEVQPEFFVFVGHGYFAEELRDLGAALGLQDNYLTQFDLLMRVRLRHNKLTLLNACVAGQGTDAGGGEVAGFVRALIGAGAGAIGITLWSVDDNEIGLAARHLLADALSAQNTSEGLFNCVDSLHRYYFGRCNELQKAQDRIEACPLALYL